MTILVSRFGNIENREQTGGDDEQCRIYQVTPRTNALSSAKCEGDGWVVSECPIFVKESLRLELFRFWIETGVVENRPRDFCSENIMQDSF